MTTPGPSRVTVYSTDWCGFCQAATRLLEDRGIDYDRIDISGDPAFRQRVFDLSGQWTVPLVVVDGRTVGGFRELLRLDRSGGLDLLMAA